MLLGNRAGLRPLQHTMLLGNLATWAPAAMKAVRQPRPHAGAPTAYNTVRQPESGALQHTMLLGNRTWSRQRPRTPQLAYYAAKEKNHPGADKYHVLAAVGALKTFG